MKKEEIERMQTPLTNEDFLKLKNALIYRKIARNDIPVNVLKSLDEMWLAENQKLKEEVSGMKIPLSQRDFEKLKQALDFEEIERSDIPDEVLFSMDKTWANENQKRYNELLADGTFGAYD